MASKRYPRPRISPPSEATDPDPAPDPVVLCSPIMPGLARGRTTVKGVPRQHPFSLSPLSPTLSLSQCPPGPPTPQKGTLTPRHSQLLHHDLREHATLCTHAQTTRSERANHTRDATHTATSGKLREALARLLLTRGEEKKMRVDVCVQRRKFAAPARVDFSELQPDERRRVSRCGGGPNGNDRAANWHGEAPLPGYRVSSQLG